MAYSPSVTPIAAMMCQLHTPRSALRPQQARGPVVQSTCSVHLHAALGAHVVDKFINEVGPRAAVVKVAEVGLHLLQECARARVCVCDAVCVAHVRVQTVAGQVSSHVWEQMPPNSTHMLNHQPATRSTQTTQLTLANSNSCTHVSLLSARLWCSCRKAHQSSM